MIESGRFTSKSHRASGGRRSYGLMMTWAGYDEHQFMPAHSALWNCIDLPVTQLGEASEAGQPGTPDAEGAAA